MESSEGTNLAPEPESVDTGRHRSFREQASIVIALVLFSAGAFAIYRLLHSVNVRDVVAQFHSIPSSTLGLALLTTLGSYAALVGYDWSALRYIGKSVPPLVLVTGSFSAYALGNTIGLSALSGGAVRYRMYRGLGLDAADIAVVSSFCALALAIGMMLVGLTAAVLHPNVSAAWFTLAPSTLRWLALGTLVLMVGSGLWLSLSRRTVKIGRFSIGMPEPRILGAQVLFSAFDILLAATTLYLLLPASVGINFPAFAVVFAIAAVVAMISHVPGGIGVFESVIIAGIATSPTEVPGVVAALFAYRAVYYLIPFVMALGLLVVLEIVTRSRFAERYLPSAKALGNLVDESGPVLVAALSAVIFLVGAILLLNGLIPIPKNILDEVTSLVPTTVLELSNVILGVVGACLVLLSNALRQRVRAAFWICCALLLVAFASLVAQSIDYDIAAVVLVVALLLWGSRGEFYRASRLSSRMFSIEWAALVGALVLALALTLVFSHTEGNYSHDLWWQFGHDNDTPRAFRFAASAAVAALIGALYFALRPARKVSTPAQLPDAQLLKAIIDAQDDPDAGFVFTGDKDVLLAPDQDAFIMYARQGRTFVALGDPIGNRAAGPALVDAFITLADRENCRPAFYQIAPDRLPLYIDAGFVPSKLGEEAEVELEHFSLNGSGRSKLRQRHARAERDGLAFEWLAAPHSSELLAELRTISDEWLAHKNAREKAFSIGRFDESYLQQSPLAIVRANNTIVAFSNILITGTGVNATIDLMRYRDIAPSGTMDYLFVALMLDLKAKGYQEFSLGMAPLVGLERSRRKRLWDHLGIAVARFGGHFYNFEGLRDYKNKFGPRWESRYMATWGGADPLLVAADVNAIVSGGLKGSIGRARGSG